MLAGTDKPLVIANFQQERFYRQETGRYRRIAQRTDRVYVLAAPETDFASAPAPYATIGLEPTDELAQEWHLAIVGQNYSACLICREYAAPYEFAPASSLLGQNWQLATHPQFQATIDRGNIVSIADTSQDSGIQLHPDLQRQLAQAQIQACLLVPISDRHHCLAVLELHQDCPYLWSGADRELLATIATQVGIAIIQAEAFVNLQQLNQQLVAVKQTQNNLIAISLAVSHLQAVAQPRDLPTVIVDLPPVLPLAIADNEAFFQLLSKILDNACKFTPPTGMITVTIEEVEIPTSHAKPALQPMLEVQIADTGRGIEPDRLETIFERFHQEEGFLQRAVGGAGLGLAICRQLARQLGGQIWATSQGKGRGSQFYFTLPVLVN